MLPIVARKRQTSFYMDVPVHGLVCINPFPRRVVVFTRAPCGLGVIRPREHNLDLVTVIVNDSVMVVRRMEAQSLAEMIQGHDPSLATGPRAFLGISLCAAYAGVAWNRECGQGGH